MLAVADAHRDREEAAVWSSTVELLAQLVEFLSVWRAEWLLSQGVDKARLPEPIHYPRPGEEPAEAKQEVVVSPREFARLMMVA